MSQLNENTRGPRRWLANKQINKQTKINHDKSKASWIQSAKRTKSHKSINLLIPRSKASQTKPTEDTDYEQNLSLSKLNKQGQARLIKIPNINSHTSTAKHIFLGTWKEVTRSQE